jgi:hypothetical protein
MVQVEEEDRDIIDGHGEEAHKTALLLPQEPQEPREIHRHNQYRETQPLSLQLQWHHKPLPARMRIQTEGTMGSQIEAGAEGRAKEEERPGM